MKVVDVTLGSTSVDYIDISWKVADTFENSLHITYQVLRGENLAGPFEAVSDPLIDRFHLRDYIAPRKMSWRNLYYVIETVNTITGESTRSDPVNLRARPPLDALEMIRLNTLLFKEFVGRPCLIYSLRTYGEKCTNCFDEITQRRTVSNCHSCYGTGYARGFNFPMYAYVKISPEQRGNMPNQASFVTQQAQVQANMSIYPLVKVGDIIIEYEGTRWRIQNVSYTERLRSPVQQMLMLARIPECDIEYKLPVSWDGVDQFNRNYSYRTSL